ncbi:hypothetical protein [Euzebya tangerina]|uniref:hypothetical protein n=1 Tax=Euzebya tangerina TaxID=591198 RepID=UPI00196AF26C|nr:hypothetical protein [Euzebya tangerina]
MTDHGLDRRPDGVDDETVEALGTLGEALETIERARGHLYSFHQLCGTVDLTLGQAADQLRDAGHDDAADRLDHDIVGRNVIEGRWSFQIVEEYDDHYYSAAMDAGSAIRERLANGVRHIYEAEMKARRINASGPRQRATPRRSPDSGGRDSRP